MGCWLCIETRRGSQACVQAHAKEPRRALIQARASGCHQLAALYRERWPALRELLRLRPTLANWFAAEPSQNFCADLAGNSDVARNSDNRSSDGQQGPEVARGLSP